MMEAMKLYGITDDQNVYNLANPSGKVCQQVMTELDERLRVGGEMTPQKRFLVIFMFTGQGVVKESMTEMVLNEFDESTQFYRLFRAESLIREMSEQYPHAYMVTVFACDRQKLKHIKKTLQRPADIADKPATEQGELAGSFNYTNTPSQSNDFNNFNLGLTYSNLLIYCDTDATEIIKTFTSKYDSNALSIQFP